MPCNRFFRISLANILNFCWEVGIYSVATPGNFISQEGGGEGKKGLD